MNAPSRCGWWTRLAVVTTLAALIAAFYVSGLHEVIDLARIKANLSDLQTRADANLLLAVLVFFLAYVAVVALSLPIAVWLSLLAGAVFGRWLGFAVVSLAATLGATLAMLSSRYVFRDWVQRRFGHRLAAINRGFERDGVYYLLTLRMMPVVPFWLINLGMGLTPIRTRTFALVSWVGMMPGTFVYVNAGTELATIESPRDVLSTNILIALLALASVPLAIKYMLKWLRPMQAPLA